jgi:hypothetical protein
VEEKKFMCICKDEANPFHLDVAFAFIDIHIGRDQPTAPLEICNGLFCLRRAVIVRITQGATTESQALQSNNRGVRHHMDRMDQLACRHHLSLIRRMPKP